MLDPLLGRPVSVTSVGGIEYSGIVKEVHDRGADGELFVLGSESDPDYQRLVFVLDRQAQVRET